MSDPQRHARDAAVTPLFEGHQASSGHKASHQHMAVQVLHGLRHEHRWTDLQIHSHGSSGILLPRPMLSGKPPQHVYVHPDDQIQMLKQGQQDQDVPVSREWVLPTHLEEKWSIHKFAQVFDAIDNSPPSFNDEMHNFGAAIPQRRARRLLLAIIGDDSTIVYYIVHDGIVKPRQN